MGFSSWVKKAFSKARDVTNSVIKTAAPVVKSVYNAAAPVVKTMAEDAYHVTVQPLKNLVDMPEKMMGLFKNPMFLIVAGIGGVAVLFVLLKFA